MILSFISTSHTDTSIINRSKRNGSSYQLFACGNSNFLLVVLLSRITSSKHVTMETIDQNNKQIIIS